MINLAKATGGFYRSITEGDGLEIEDPECDVADFSKHLEKLGEPDDQPSDRLQPPRRAGRGVHPRVCGRHRGRQGR